MHASGDDLLECVERETGPDPAHCVVWLHGLGADGNDFAPIVPQLRSAASRPVRFVFPHAPVRPVTINGGMRMRAWYDIRGPRLSRDQDAEGIADSLSRVDALLDSEIRRGFAPERIVLAGFSQGGAIALRCGLARSPGLAGVVALSCYLLQADELGRWLTDGGRGTPVFVGHGSMDPMVPAELGRDAARRLEAEGLDCAWRTWPVAHGVHPDEIAAIDDWLERRFEAAR
ncbi:MAG: carboxylesterase [Wenzhouxiangellaceae bacterium]|nr:carboxylesterase [Wenzhouxiangellaceae bacterium]